MKALVAIASLTLAAGCYDACFEMATDSRLPKWFDEYRSIPRNKLTVEVCYYASPTGGRARFFLYDDEQSLLSRKDGAVLPEQRVSILPGYPAFEIISIDGTTDLLETSRPFRMSDSSEVWQMLRDRGLAEGQATSSSSAASSSPRCTSPEALSIDRSFTHAIELLRACRQSQAIPSRTTEQPCGLFREYFQTRLVECLTLARDILVASDNPQVAAALFGLASELAPSQDAGVSSTLARALEARTDYIVAQLRLLPRENRIRVLDMVSAGLELQKDGVSDARKIEMHDLAKSLRREASDSLSGRNR